ncbi:hypothetical protein LUZ61_009952 [Rhynchospora tenuis]|uniref:F-box domain-containing protein n=1 Tax=Rhynchospora tenuis TaxID=198213 RepID=A0AAD5ZY68_9POAL|nr:hypothetical protein LUZ61_009952 [Rhynchospora tenuis]
MARSQPIARSPDWSVLPPELLQMVARKLPDISDFVKFRAVCTTWRSSACVSDPPPQLPWFLETAGYFNRKNLRFYSLLSGKIHTIPSPNSSGNWLRGPAHDYIILYDTTRCQISLFNPLTGRKVFLPFLDIAWLWHKETVKPVWVGPDPIESGEPVVLLGYSLDFRTGILALYQPVAREWVVIEEPCLCSLRCCYFNGMCYVHEEVTGDTRVIDTVIRKVVHVIPPPPEGDYECNALRGATYLVQSGGDILLVVLHCYDFCNVYLEMADWHFHIHRLDLRSGNGKKPRWVKISSIGDQILFLDEDNGFSLSCRDFGEFRGNSIYFIIRRYDQSLSFLCRYDIEEARAEPLYCPSEKGGTWIVPSLR